MLDCEHLVPPLETRLVPIEDYLISAVRYDRARRILEIHLHAGGAHQHFGVPLDLALKIVRSPLPEMSTTPASPHAGSHSSECE